MADIKLKGNPFHTQKDLPGTGTRAADFMLTGNDLGDVSLKHFVGKRIVMNIFPSLDTPVCAASVRRFNAEAGKIKDTVVLCISKDLPFAHGRFCAAEGLTNVVTLSAFRDNSFAEGYGVTIKDGPLAGLFSRAIVIIDEQGIITYTEQVPEITQEPDYQAALESVNSKQ
ncbi:MAG: thiol peroxidase [Bacteroidetes bacterium]|nr:thiol peroxidase [Bacteroidota bacterium]